MSCLSGDELEGRWFLPLSAAMVLLDQYGRRLLREEGVGQQEYCGRHQEADWQHLTPHGASIRVQPAAGRAEGD